MSAPTNTDFGQVGERIGELLSALADSGDDKALYAAEESVRLLVELYGEGLTRVVTTLAETDDGRARLHALTGDGLVASLLIVHGLHPVSLEQRIDDALDSVRPYLGSHAGGVEVIGVDDEGILQLRLQGSCDGCSSSAETVRVAIENAVLKAAPEVIAVRAEGMVERPKKTELLQIQPYRSAEAPPPEPVGPGWHTLSDPPSLSPGQLVRVELGGVPVLLIRTDTQRYAYRDRCGTCSAGLADGLLAGSILTCAACSASYDVAIAGRAADGEDHLDPLPLLADGGGVRIAIPAGVGSGS